MVINEDSVFNGILSAVKGFIAPLGFLRDKNVAADAAIAASKLGHQFQPIVAQDSATTAFTETRVIHVVNGLTGAIVGFRAGAVVANIGAATVTVDLKKNGTTILTGTILLNSSVAARATVDASLSSTTLVAGDVLEVTFTATAGGGTLATGAFAQLISTEDAA